MRFWCCLESRSTGGEVFQTFWCWRDDWINTDLLIDDCRAKETVIKAKQQWSLLVCSKESKAKESCLDFGFYWKPSNSSAAWNLHHTKAKQYSLRRGEKLTKHNRISRASKTFRSSSTPPHCQVIFHTAILSTHFNRVTLLALLFFLHGCTVMGPRAQHVKK